MNRLRPHPLRLFATCLLACCVLASSGCAFFLPELEKLQPVEGGDTDRNSDAAVDPAADASQTADP